MLLIWPLEKWRVLIWQKWGNYWKKKKKEIPRKPERKVKRQKHSTKNQGGKKTPKKPKSVLKLDNGTSPKGNQPGNLGNRESYSNILKIASEFN